MFASDVEKSNNFKCPMKNAKCHRCYQKGPDHFMCRSKASVSSIQEHSEEESTFLGAIHSHPNYGKNPWTVTFNLNGSAKEFKIYSGANGTMVVLKSSRLILEQIVPLHPLRCISEAKMMP